MIAIDADVLEQIESYRHRAQGIADACEIVLAQLRALGEPAVTARRQLQRTIARRTYTRRKPVAKRARVVARRKAAATPEKPPAGKAGAYAESIASWLEKQPLQTADSAVLRRELAKVNRIDPDKDPSYRHAISNALTKLKVARRKGSLWTLVRPEQD